MTFPMTTQILHAERDLRLASITEDGRFVPTGHLILRELGANILRWSSQAGLRLADRVDPEIHFA